MDGRVTYQELETAGACQDGRSFFLNMWGENGAPTVREVVVALVMHEKTHRRQGVNWWDWLVTRDESRLIPDDVVSSYKTTIYSATSECIRRMTSDTNERGTCTCGDTPLKWMRQFAQIGELPTAPPVESGPVLDIENQLQESDCTEGWVCERHTTVGWPHEGCDAPGKPCQTPGHNPLSGV